MVDKSAHRPRGRPRGFDPDEALDRAIPVFWRLGYEGADLETLSEAMGVGKPSIYAAFGDKEALFLQTMDRYAATVGCRPLQALADAPDIASGVAAAFAATLHNVSGAGGARGCLAACVAADSAEAMPAVRGRLAAGLEATQQAIGACLERGRARGELPAGFPVQERAAMMTDLMHAMALRARSGAECGDLRAAADRAVRAVLAGAEGG